MPAWLQIPAWFGVIGKAIAEGVAAYLLRSPRLLRAIAGYLQRKAPILCLPGTVIVTRADDVREVLERPDDFLLGPINAGKMLTGEFVIALDPGEQYDREKYLQRQVLTMEAVQRLAALAAPTAEEALKETVRDGRRFNAVEYAERFMLHVVERFWGLDTAAARSEVVQADEGADTMRLWLRRLAAVLTSTEPAPFGLWQAAHLCRDEYMAYIREACDARRVRGGPPGNDALSRLVFAQLQPPPTSDEVARNVGGLIVTGTAVVTKAFAHALEQLLLRPVARRGVVEAALAGRADDVRRHLIEALRFKPVFPMLARRCVRGATLARGTPRETEVPAGATVYISPIGAMFDQEVVEQSECFNEQRPFDDNPWLSGRAVVPGARPGPTMIFGAGRHWCPADELALTDLTAMAMALLRATPDLRLVSALRYDGPAAAELMVEG